MKIGGEIVHHDRGLSRWVDGGFGALGGVIGEPERGGEGRGDDDDHRESNDELDQREAAGVRETNIFASARHCVCVLWYARLVSVRVSAPPRSCQLTVRSIS